MTNKNFKIHNTNIDNLVSNLRGEVGEIISTWVLMRNFMGQAAGMRTDDVQKDLENLQLIVLDALTDKLSDEIIARLAELAEQKVGRLTFYFAHLKLKALEGECEEFSRFIEQNRFREKRNYDISHKELPEKWEDHKYVYVPYTVVVRAIVMALRLMKKIDRLHLGPRATYLWREVHRRRYKVTHPAKLSYMLLPYFWLSVDDRAAIIKEELAEGCDKWKDEIIKFNGTDVRIKTYGELGAIAISGRMMFFDEPFIELTAIDFVPAGEGNQDFQAGASC